MKELLKLIEENKKHLYLSDELMRYYYDSGSFSNVYSCKEYVVKVFFDINELSFLKKYLTEKVRLSLDKMMHSLNYLNNKEYDVNDYISFILNEMIKEPNKLNELSYIKKRDKINYLSFSFALFLILLFLLFHPIHSE